jgi:hypothetical protein
MKKILTFVLLASFLLSKCNINEPIVSEKNYTGITPTGEAGELLGTVDPDDWYYIRDTSSAGTSLPSKYAVHAAYPNPTKRYSKFKISLPKTDSVKIWIDDPMANKETVIINTKLYAGLYSIKIDLFYGDDKYKRNPGIVRVFVDFINVGDIPIIHGDIQIYN